MRLKHADLGENVPTGRADIGVGEQQRRAAHHIVHPCGGGIENTARHRRQSHHAGASGDGGIQAQIARHLRDIDAQQIGRSRHHAGGRILAADIHRTADRAHATAGCGECDVVADHVRPGQAGATAIQDRQHRRQRHVTHGRLDEIDRQIAIGAGNPDAPRRRGAHRRAGIDLDIVDTARHDIADGAGKRGQGDVVGGNLDKTGVERVEDRTSRGQQRIASRRVDGFQLHVAQQRAGSTRKIRNIDHPLGPRRQRGIGHRLDIDRKADIVGIRANAARCGFQDRIAAPQIDRRGRRRVDDALLTLDADLRTGQRIARRHLIELNGDGGIDEHILTRRHRQRPGCVDVQRGGLGHIDGGNRRRNTTRDTDRLRRRRRGLADDRIARAQCQCRGGDGGDFVGLIFRRIVVGRSRHLNQLAHLIAIADPAAAIGAGDQACTRCRVGGEIHRHRLSRRRCLESRVQHDRCEGDGFTALGHQRVAGDRENIAVDGGNLVEHRAGGGVLRHLGAAGADGEIFADRERIPIAAIGAGDGRGAEIHRRGDRRTAEILHIRPLCRRQRRLLRLGEDNRRLRDVDRNCPTILAHRPLGDQRDIVGHDVGGARRHHRAGDILHQPGAEQRHQLIRRPFLDAADQRGLFGAGDLVIEFVLNSNRLRRRGRGLGGDRIRSRQRDHARRHTGDGVGDRPQRGIGRRAGHQNGLPHGEAIGEPIAAIGAGDRAGRAAAGRREIRRRCHLRAQRLVCVGIKTRILLGISAANAKDGVQLLVFRRLRVHQCLKGIGDLGRGVAKPGIITFIRSRACGRQCHLEIRIIDKAAIGLLMAILPIQFVGSVLLARIGGQGRIHLCLVSSARRKLQFAPHRIEQLRLGARIGRHVGVGIQQAAIRHVDPDIATSRERIKPQVASGLFQIDICLCGGRQGIGQTRDRIGRVDDQRLADAVADTAALSRQRDDATRHQPLPATGHRDAAGGEQGHISLRITLDQIHGNAAGDLADDDVARTRRCRQAACAPKHQRRRDHLDRSRRIANAAHGLQHHRRSGGLLIERVRQNGGVGGDRRRAGRVEDIAVEIDIARARRSHLHAARCRPEE